MTSLMFVAAAAMICGCSKAIPSKPPAQKPAAFSQLPVEISVKQRSTTTIPGSNFRLTIDDITRGQVMASIADTDGRTALAAVSLKEGESAAFTVDGDEYRITLQELDNELVGDDLATFIVSNRLSSTQATPSRAEPLSPSQRNPSVETEEPKTNTVSERDRIERLLRAIEKDEGVIFIRNEAEHSAKEAVEHLRSKWAAAGDQIETADDFIENVASKSSLTGEPYRVRLSDGAIVPASDYLRRKLEAIQQRPPQTNNSSR